MAERFAILCIAPDWTSPPRTARQLTLHGAEVCVIAPPGSYTALTRFKAADILMPAAEISRKLPAIVCAMAEEFRAHSILASDNAAFTYLAQLITRVDALGASEETRALLRRSMPDAALAPIVAQDSVFITAQHGGPCPPPETIADPSLDEALQFAAQFGFPLVVKRDSYAAGKGVTICVNDSELRTALGAMHGRFVLQRHVCGDVHGVAVAGVSGTSAGAICFAKHQVWPEPHGAATVIRHAPRPDIIADACRLFELYGLNGYAGFDYIVDPDGRAHLIEVNPYIVEGHISACFGCDLTAAFLAAVRGQPAPQPAPPRHELVAFFPNEWRRNPASPYLHTAHHDTPWDDPDLFAAMVRDCTAKPAHADANLGA